MKRLALFAVFSVSVVGIADPIDLSTPTLKPNFALPVETDTMRRDVLQTKGTVLIKGGRVLTVTKGSLDNTDVLIEKGKITQIGKNLKAPTGAAVIDATGKVVMPGIVDAHVHRGADATNEGSDSITAECRIEDVLNPTAKNIWQALAGGETTGMVLHGSANCIGGQSQVIKFKYQRPVSQLPFPGAPRMIKFALGENVTRSGQTPNFNAQNPTPQRYPRTRMGQQSVYRRGFIEAQAYMKAWDAWEKDKSKPKPQKDLRLDALADILRGKIWVQCHSYRADEMLMMVRLSQEFGFKIGALQHALEAYKIAPELAEAGIGVSMFVDNWSFKIEGYDAIPYNAEIATKAGVNVSINTDGTGGLPNLALDAAKVMRFGNLSEDQALAMLTINPARQLGVDKKVGSLEVGKDGDVAIWDGHPLSPYSRASHTLVDGEVFFQRKDLFGVDKILTLPQTLPANNKVRPLSVAKAPAYAIVGATVHPVSGPRIEDGVVVMRGGTIESVGGSGTAVPSDARRVDGKGLHVYPGLIDAGNSIGLAEISPIGQTIDANELGDMQPDLLASVSMNVQSEHFPVARCGGVLTSFSRPGGGTISGRGSVVNTWGWTSESMSLKNDLLVVNFPGAGGGFGGEFDDHDACLGGDVITDHDAIVEELLARNAAKAEEFMGGQGGRRGGAGAGAGGSVASLESYFQKAAEYANSNGTGDPYLDAMKPYVSGRMPVVLKVRNEASIKNAVAFGEKMKLKIILSGAPDAWKVTELLSSKNIPVIINPAGKSTLNSNSPIGEYDPYDTTFVLPYLLKKGGVKYCFATEDNSGTFNLSTRAATSVGFGSTAEDILKACTLDAAQILGVGDKLGSLEKGKMANVVVTDGDIFQLTTNIAGIWINGRMIPLESKFTRLREQYLQRLND